MTQHRPTIDDMTPREIALLAGRRSYLGRPCPRCGSRERAVGNSDCLPCRTLRNAERRLSRPQKPQPPDPEASRRAECAMMREAFAGWAAQPVRRRAGWLG